MCGSVASRRTTSGGLSPSGKVASLSSRGWGVVLDPALRRVNISRNPGMPGSGAMAATLAMVSLVQTWAWVVAGGKVGVPCAWFGVPCAWFGSGCKVRVRSVWNRTGQEGR